MNSEIKDWADWARSQGWTVEDDQSGHTRFYDPSGNYVTDYPCTPSSHRRLTGLKTALKRAGLQIPPPSKKEQRSLRRKEGK